MQGVDHLFIESAFRSRDRHLAAAKYHLTADQAGRIAARAGVQRYTLFHFSPRYDDAGEAMRTEAERSYRRTPSQTATGYPDNF